jgi:hypothetical protein
MFENVLRFFWAVLLACFGIHTPTPGPCLLEVNGHCYDTGDPALPPLTAKLQLMDAETGRGIPDAWVSLRWYARHTSKRPAPCVRSVLGRTDEQGWFSSTGKDGSWFFGEVHYFAPGYEHLRIAGVRANRFEAYVNIHHNDDLELLGPWLRSLERLGYEHVDDGGTTTKYSKWISIPPGFEKRNNYLFDSEGKVLLMATRRTLPTDLGVLGSVWTYCDDAGSERIGYDAPNEFALARKLMWTEDYQLVCDPRWFGFDTVSVPDWERWRIDSALELHPEPEKIALLRRFAPAYVVYMDHSNNLNPLRPTDLSRAERTALCAALKPHALPTPFPPAANEASP